MKNFKKLQQERPELAKMLNEMSKEELLDHYALEVFEKTELEEYKETLEFYKRDLESIVNLGIQWLKDNKKDNHKIIINQEVAKLIYLHTEQKFI